MHYILVHSLLSLALRHWHLGHPLHEVRWQGDGHGAEVDPGLGGNLFVTKPGESGFTLGKCDFRVQKGVKRLNWMISLLLFGFLYRSMITYMSLLKR